MTIALSYRLTPAVVLDGMFTAGKNIPRSDQIKLTVAYLISTLLTVAGGAAVAFAIGVNLTGTAEGAMRYVPFGIIGGAAFHFFYARWTYRIMAKKTATSIYGDNLQQAVFDAVGFTISNDHASWHTKWAAVEGIEPGKRAITLSVAAIAFMIPLDVIDDPDAFLAQLRDWKGAA